MRTPTGIGRPSRRGFLKGAGAAILGSPGGTPASDRITMGFVGVGPVEIEGAGVFPKDGLWNTAIDYHIEYRYANGLRIITDSRNPDGSAPTRGIKFVGTDGWLFIEIHGGRLEAEPEGILRDRIGDNEIHLHESPGHHDDWFRAIRTRGPTVVPVDQGHRTASFCHLGHIAILLGRKLVWDGDKEQFLNDDDANRMVRPPVREPWRL